MSPPLRALWWAAKGDWNRGHEIAQSENSADAACDMPQNALFRLLLQFDAPAKVKA
jgi:hypothetical protein